MMIVHSLFWTHSARIADPKTFFVSENFEIKPRDSSAEMFDGNPESEGTSDGSSSEIQFVQIGVGNDEEDADDDIEGSDATSGNESGGNNVNFYVCTTDRITKGPKMKNFNQKNDFSKLFRKI